MSEWDVLRLMCPHLYKKPIHFECGPGWYDIILDISIKIENILEKYADTHKVVEGEESEYIEMFAIQVKEKYGTLRFYMTCETDEISKLIQEYEAMSSQTCENCSAPAKMRGKRFLEVKCDKCYQEVK